VTAHLRTAVRRFSARPGLAFTRLLTVMIVVAALGAVFAVANATLLAPLPFPDPDRLVRVYFQPPGTTSFAAADSLDALAFVRFRDRTRTMDQFVGIFIAERGLTGDREPESVWSGRVTAGFFETLGATAGAGRTFTPDEYASGGKVVVLGHALWMQRFGGDRGVVGRSLIVDREPHTVVGVIAPVAA
jgi:putative ABC transport system permease protein